MLLERAATAEQVAAITAFFEHAGCLVSSGGMVGMLTEAAAEELREQYETFLARPTEAGFSALWQEVAARLTAPEGAYWELADPDTGATLGSDNYVKAASGTISGTLTETTGGTGAPGVWAAAWDGTGLRLTNLNTGLLLDEEDGAATLSAEGAVLSPGADGCVEVGGARREVRIVETISKTISSYGIATAHYPFAVRVPDGLTAKAAVQNSDHTQVNLTALGTSELPAYTPVVLDGAAGTYALTLLPEGAAALDVENDLTGVCCMETIADDVTALIMGVVDSEVGFYVLSSVNRTLGANICYIIDS